MDETRHLISYPHTVVSLSASPNILFLKYEDMKKDSRAAIAKVDDFTGCALEPSAIDSIAGQVAFDKMKKIDTMTD